MDGLEWRFLLMAEETTNTTQGTQNDPQDTQTSQVTTNTTSTTDDSQTAQNNAQNNSAHSNIEELIQKAVDRATNRLGNDNKKLREQLETFKKNKLTDDERRQLEIADKEADIADREAKLREKENRLFAIKAIKDAGLDDGSSNALELVDFVMTDNEETTTERVKAFDALVKKFVSAEVSRTFKDNGRNPEKGGSSNADTKSDIAINIGKAAAERNAAANKVLSQYLGGNK